jgi:hypothetical protein
VSVGASGWELDARLLAVLESLDVPFERVEVGAYVVTLEGVRRPSTRVWLLAGLRAVDVEAFVVHVVPDGCPDPSLLHRHLLQRNLALRWVRYGLDEVGDVFVTGSVPPALVDAATLDVVLGEILALLERDQDTVLRLAYSGRLAGDAALQAKALTDGSGRRAAGSHLRDVTRDSRR